MAKQEKGKEKKKEERKVMCSMIGKAGRISNFTTVASGWL